MNSQQLILEVTLAKEKSRNKAKMISENFEIGELVRISNHTKVLKNSDHIVYNPSQGLMKGIIKERWKIKARVLKNRMNYCKVQIIEIISENQNFINNDVWNVTKQVLKRVITVKFQCTLKISIFGVLGLLSFRFLEFWGF